MASYDSLNIVDKIIRSNLKFQKYATQLSPLAKMKDFSGFKEGHLQDEYHIENAQDASEILDIIQQINTHKHSLNSKTCKEILKKYSNGMNTLLDKKTLKDLRNECSDEKCEFAKCEPLQRIDIVLHTYKLFIEEQELWNKISISSVININDKYSHQQLADDFLHVHIVHCQLDEEKENQKKILRKRFTKKYACENIEKCLAFKRHYRDRNIDAEEERSQFERKFGALTMNKAMEISHEKAAVFQQECDKIHAYFLHEIYEEACRYNEEPETKENRNVMRRQPSRKNIFEKKMKPYIGRKEDEEWWGAISPNDNNSRLIYFKLVRSMGVFRWQSAHGFRVGENRAIEHLKKKYSNIKEEALNNIYHPLTKDNWNQTLRKSKIFYQSWAKHKISAGFAGYFDDKVSGNFAEWKKGIEITLQEIVMLKLYTDFDKLQFALKKCFRSENLQDIWRRNLNRTEKEKEWLNRTESDQPKSKWRARVKKKKSDLEQRIKEFFHWRSGLMIVLNKFGTKLSSKKNMILYHGVNTKMIIKPTATFGFYGPLSTTTSPHVARTFATAKGMVLKIASYFPNLNYCTAFNASLISDYPEEQEWLVGFMYVRILEVRTRKLIDNPQSWEDIIKKVPMASWMRAEFFAIHLFREQMFSMSEHLERMQAQYLRANRYECCKNKQEYKNKYKDYQIEDFSWEDRLECLCYMGARHHGEEQADKYEEGKDNILNEMLEDTQVRKMITSETIEEKLKKLCSIFWERFEHFRQHPNENQSITFDNISDILKRFFMEPTKEKDIKTKQPKWVISFDEIITVYPNVKEIHFVNNYRFDETVLRKLVHQIQKNGNTLMKVTFSYYYDIKDNDMTFKNPNELKHSMLDKNILNVKGNKWEIKHSKNGKVGYKIIISKKK